jgi:hypothetical protein
MGTVTLEAMPKFANSLKSATGFEAETMKGKPRVIKPGVIWRSSDQFELTCVVAPEAMCKYTKSRGTP